MSFLDNVLSDSSTPVRAEVSSESGTDDKAATVIQTAETSATSAEQGMQKTEAQAVVEKQPDRDEKGRFSKTEEADGRNVALREERERRRRAEAEIEQLKAGKKEPTSVFENEDKAISERVEQHLQPLRVRFFNLSEKTARGAYKDYDEVREAFVKEAESKPHLLEQLRAADDPGEFIYSEGLRARELGEVNGDFVAYRTKVESKFTEKMTALETENTALKAKVAAFEASKEKQSKIPQSLNTETSATQKAEAFAGPTPLKNILNS